MTVRFNVKDIPEQGLELVTSADPQFPTLLSHYFNDNSEKRVREPAPFSVFLRNQGRRPVVAYVLKWEMLGANGITTTQFSSYAQPGILLGYGVNIPIAPGQGHVIAPGSMRLFTINSPIDPIGKPAMGSMSSIGSSEEGGLDLSVKPSDRARSALLKLSNVTVSVDGAFFDDGRFVGPNTSHYFERVKAEVDAKSDLLAKIADADKKPNGADHIFETLQTGGDQDQFPTYVEATPEAQYEYYSKAYAREILAMKSAYGKDKVVAHVRSLHNLTKPKLIRIVAN